MKNEAIKTISIKDFKAYNHILDYVDEDFVVVNSMENIPYSNGVIRLNCFLTIFCVEGRIQVDINSNTYLLEENHVMLCPPSVILSHTMISPNHKIRIMGFSSRFLQHLVKMEKDTWSTFSYVYSNPVKHFGEIDYLPFKQYLDVIMMKINGGPHRYRKEIMQYLFSAFFCEMMAYFNKQAAGLDETETVKEDVKQADYIFKRFMEKLSVDNGTHRTVTYYANALFYTPKYLSKVVKQISGRTALDLINEHAIDHIKYQLKHSDKSIKEIADEFNFSNLSFFGKYVKARLGVSPTAYRNSLEE